MRTALERKLLASSSDKLKLQALNATMLTELAEDAESRFVILFSAAATGKSNFKGLYKLIAGKNSQVVFEKKAGPSCLPFRVFKDMVQTCYTFETVQK